MVLKILVLAIFSFLFFPLQNTYAQESEILFFWGTTCPFCHTVMDDMEEMGIHDEIEISMLEIYEDEDNLEIFREKIDICGINPNQAGVPLLFVEDECFVGPNMILTRLAQLTDMDIELIEENEQVEQIDVDDLEEDPGRRNTLYLIMGIFFVLALLLIVGYAKEAKKKSMLIVLLLLPFSYFLFLPSPVNALCPVCTVAAGAGLGLSRYFGIDDVITGVWIGGLMTSMVLWFVSWLDGKEMGTKKKIIFKFLLVISFIALVVYTLFALGVVGDSLNTLWGLDKVLLGMSVGAISFLASAKLHFYVKEKNNDKVLFPYQKVIFTISMMLLVTLIFYLIVY